MGLHNVLLLTLFGFFSFCALADNLDKGSTYRLGITLNDLEEVGEPNKKYTAGKNSKFYVLSVDESGNYIIRFDLIHTPNDVRSADRVHHDKSYLLKSPVYNAIPIEAISFKSNTGLSSGPLVVPFKYRLDDKSISGDATVGFYAGVTFEPNCVFDNWCFRITPLISAGISQVSVAEVGGSDTENKTSATWATGLLITDWSNMNIGLIYGQDRIGDKSWKHEGEGWFSFMIGWQL